MSQSISQTDLYFEKLDEITNELSDAYSEMTRDLEQLWSDIKEMHCRKMKNMVEEVSEKINELSIIKSQATGYSNEFAKANELIKQLKNLMD